MTKHVLVTGGAGYIGSHTCKALAKAGYVPVTYDNLSRGNSWAVKWGPLEVGDIQDDERLISTIERYQIEAAIHFAALAYVGESTENPGIYYKNNVAGTLSLLEALRISEVHNIVFSSTCATYGIPEFLPLTERHPQRPINPYGASKLMIEGILTDFDRAYNFRSVSLRYFNAAGADPEAEIGECHNPETHIIPLALMAATDRERAFTVFGSDYSTPDGTCIRDFVHVSDLADAHVLALQYLTSGNPTCCLNLGTGKGWSVSEVLDTAKSITNSEIRVIPGERRAGDPPILVADATLVKYILGWQPKYPDIRTQMDHAYNWQVKMNGCLRL